MPPEVVEVTVDKKVTCWLTDEPLDRLDAMVTVVPPVPTVSVSVPAGLELKLGSVLVNTVVMLCVPAEENEALQVGTTPEDEMGRFEHSTVAGVVLVSVKVTDPADGTAGPEGLGERVAVKITVCATLTVDAGTEERLITVLAGVTTWPKVPAVPELKFVSLLYVAVIVVPGDAAMAPKR